jgi:hypothetical protein
MELIEKSVNDYFANFPESRGLFDRLMVQVPESTLFDLRVTKSQIALYRTRPFAWIWIPEKYLKRKAAPLVLSIVFPERDLSPRWKEIVEPSRGKFMHHLEIYSQLDIDEQVLIWLLRAWTNSGNTI